MRLHVILGALLACALGPTAALAQAPDLQDPVAGSQVFGAKGCSRCHSVNGIGGRYGPDLARIPRVRSFDDLAAALWNHLPRMAGAMREQGMARPRLDARGAGDLVAFLFTLDYFDPPGDVDAGRRAFGDKRCIACHQLEGSGGVVGPPLDFFRQYNSPISVAAAMWNHGPAMTVAMGTQSIPRPTFRPGELRNLVAYLQAASTGSASGPLPILPGRAVVGQRLFQERGCIGCHAVAGEGGRIGPELGERHTARSITDFASAMWNKAPAMLRAMKATGVTVPQLRPDEMADVVAYLSSVRYFAQGGDSGRGLRLAAGRACAGCHGAGDAAVPPLDSLRSLDGPAAILAALWNHVDLAGAAPVWPKLRTAEMADVTAWLQARAISQPR